jgi:predicted ArsR family transcriptional regulator
VSKVQATQPRLDSVLHQPIRTRMVAYLMARGETTFVELKNTLGVTDGNLEAHMKRLVAAGYIVARRLGGSGRPQTLYALTKTGRAALRAYINALSTLLGASR